jgi:C4-type Zn-finger protein
VVANEWGRVDEDGTVYVKTSDGERAVGQWPDGSAEEAMAFFTKRYDGLALEVDLLERRVKSGKLGPDEAGAAMRKVRTLVAEAQAVGDLEGLLARVDALEPVVAARREERKAERARRIEEAREAKEQIATEAERIAAGTDWRNGANRLRELLDRWKALPRLDRAADDALWRRFSSARTTYTRHRKQHFGELNERREAAKGVKERLAAEAESLADSTDWGPTAGRFRDLMREWKAAGPAHKDVDDKLWARFRGAQDRFFAARDAANAALDREYAANQTVKEGLLAEAERLLPVTDPRAARESFREIAAKWDAAGKVPRSAVKEMEGRLRRVENAVKAAEEERWRRSNPEARARAADTVAQLESSLADLESQRDSHAAKGNDRKADEAEQAIEARRSWLTEARKALDDFTPDDQSHPPSS